MPAAVWTNADGYYVWDDDLQVVRVQKDGYETAIQPVGADWHTDIELTPR